MQHVRTRQLLTDLRYDGTTYTTVKNWAFPAGLSVEDIDVAQEVSVNSASTINNTNRLNTLLDSGTALDTISELQAAWNSGDSTLNTAIASLTSAASTDRALIRSQVAVSIAELQTDIDTTNVLQATHAGLHVEHTAGLATKSPAHQPTFTGNVTINSTAIVGDSGTNITFNQTNMQLNTHSSGTLSGTAFNNIATGLHPTSDQVYDIGSSSKRYREVYCKDCDANQFLINGAQLNKTHIGLDKVDNVTDADKPISTLAAAKHTTTDAAVALNTAKISYSTAASAQVASNKADIVTNVAAIALNTAKVSYSSAASTQVATNKNDIATNITAIALNTPKISYSTAASAQVASNKADISTNVAAIALNTAKVTYDGAVQVATNKNDIVTNVAAIALNTAKVTYDGAVQVATNKTDISTNVAAIALNTAKVSYSSAASTQVATNETDISTNVAAIALNTAKVTYDGAVQVAQNKSDLATNTPAIALNTAKVSYSSAASTQVATNETDISTNVAAIALNTTQVATNKTDIATNVSAIALRLKTHGHQTMDGRLTVHSDGGNGCVANPHADDLQVYFYNDAGITIGAPEGKIGTLAFSDQNKADRNQIRAYSTVRDSRDIGMHFLANQLDSAVPTLSVVKTLVGINNAQPTYDLDVTGSARVTTNVFFTGLPTSDPGVTGQLWNDSNTLKISP